MKLARSFVAFAFCLSLVFLSSLSLATTEVAAQDAKIALQRGYRTGYSDGYMSGYRDVIENASKSYSRHPEYKSADRAYNADYGTLANYSDGYRQGFEIGYQAGYAKVGFDAAIPENLAFRGEVNTEPVLDTPPAVDVPVPVDDVVDASLPEDEPLDDTSDSTPVDDSTYTAPVPVSMNNKAPTITNPAPRQTGYMGDAIIVIPAETELVVELLEEIDTKTAREGDAFKARVVSPSEIGGAIIEGRIAKNRKPGRLKRRAELVLSFDRIVLSKSRWANFNAFIIEVLPVKGDNVKRIDNEGTVEGQRPYKSDSMKLGAATGTGLVIGAIVGGPVGAAVGAGVGAAFGVGAVVVERGKYIHLGEQQQLRIKTAYETQIR
ncbi:MAG: hypothetical protein DWQ47_15095 [Acidobacteria bacterium]|nr:MAG: hypothetical protein DWQ32_02495 [Acidobacteriota bacterium]REK02610.1 MAG: hypothetical protein DWQ38_09640 [Acidobacteriota bacterium]REK13587.1 MAG: hypothetical protein DWQ43_08185 [Acidobacteriota bacterium]REK41581.1 MAG: hypothetical protein DWQ47_15095 [Acidobacteriota bacterium]